MAPAMAAVIGGAPGAALPAGAARARARDIAGARAPAGTRRRHRRCGRPLAAAGRRAGDAAGGAACGASSAGGAGGRHAGGGRAPPSRAIAENSVDVTKRGGAPAVHTAGGGAHAGPGHALDGEIRRLASLRARLGACASPAARCVAASNDAVAAAYFARNSEVATAVAAVGASAGAAAELALRSVAAAGQGHVLDSARECPSARSGKLDSYLALASKLERVDVFYDALGGIVGYQLEALQQIRAAASLHRLDLGAHEGEGAGEGVGSGGSEGDGSFTRYHEPEGVDLAAPDGAALRSALAGLRALPRMAEVYPLGGAGDRLGLRDEATGEPLPVALLPYAGRSLLEGLVRDLGAREWLYYKLFGEQHTTPVAVMTSDAKGNSRRVTELCEEAGWFGRGRASFRLFEQPMVPVVSAGDGAWMVSGPLKMVMKPGGHGVIWKLASDAGVFDWLMGEEGRKAALVRQISNPMAGVRTTLLSLAGLGFEGDKPFGFASCDRAVGAAEGVNVCVERYDAATGTYSYGISNVEYTEFEKLGITDTADAEGKSKFHANTNVLYIDLAAVSRAARGGLAGGAFPGMIINLKKDIAYYDEISRAEVARKGGRLECTMQNVADFLAEDSPGGQLQAGERGSMGPFVVFNKRRFVTSSAKKQRKEGDANLHQTPDGSFLDLQRNVFEMLRGAGVALPEERSADDFLARGPAASVLIHPAMGPLWEVTRQKIRNGAISEGAELRLEVVEADIDGLRLDGSLLVNARRVMGATASGGGGGGEGDEGGAGDRIVFDDTACGRVVLHNVAVTNAGVDWAHEGTVAWAARHRRRERCEIELLGDSAFVARDVAIDGEQRFEVPDGCITIVSAGEAGEMRVETRELRDEDRWRWEYALADDGETIELSIGAATVAS